jgi:hypothetical protein
VPAAGSQRREGAKNEREKEHVVVEVLKTCHQFDEFSFAEISQNDVAALRLCVRLNRISGSRRSFLFHIIFPYFELPKQIIQQSITPTIQRSNNPLLQNSNCYAA